MAKNFFTRFMANMQVLAINQHYNNLKVSEPNFGAAKDITLEYVVKNHSKYLPERVVKKAQELISSGEKHLPQLYELHDDIYRPLFEATSLEEVKRIYPEFAKVKDFSCLENNRSKAVCAVRKIMSLKDFTLEYLKQLYRPTGQDKLVKYFGFTNRSLLGWLHKKLNIQKLSGTYIKLVQMSDEKENSRIAELSRKAITENPELQKYRLERAADAHRTPEYKAKKRQEMIDFYKRNPDKAKKTSIISQRTWDSCPGIKQAFSDYTKAASPYIRKILSKKQAGKPLSAFERKMISGYYKGFWEQHSDLRELYKKRREQVIKELELENP